MDVSGGHGVALAWHPVTLMGADGMEPGVVPTSVPGQGGESVTKHKLHLTHSELRTPSIPLPFLSSHPHTYTHARTHTHTHTHTHTYTHTHTHTLFIQPFISSFDTFPLLNFFLSGQIYKVHSNTRPIHYTWQPSIT